MSAPPVHEEMRGVTLLLIIVGLLSIGFPSNVSSQQQAVRATAGADGVQRINLVAGEYFFEPRHIIVKLNVPVEITATKKRGMTPHNIVIKAPEAGIEISESLSTKPRIIRLTPRKSGTYAFYCDKKLLFFKSHRGKGMEGVLEVRP